MTARQQPQAIPGIQMRPHIAVYLVPCAPCQAQPGDPCCNPDGSLCTARAQEAATAVKVLACIRKFRLIILDGLDDAAAGRQPDGYCDDCADQPCADHRTDAAKAGAYRWARTCVAGLQPGDPG